MSDDRGLTRRGHAARLLGDYPNALRFRAHAVRYRAVPAAFAEGRLRPVVILPGIYESWHYLRPIAERLNEGGHPVHVIPTLGLNRAPIPRTAAGRPRSTGRARSDRRRDRGAQQGRHRRQARDGARRSRSGRVDRLVAIASPFNGSAMARLAPNPALRAFLADDPVIAGAGGRARGRTSASPRSIRVSTRTSPRGARSRARGTSRCRWSATSASCFSRPSSPPSARRSTPERARGRGSGLA